MTTTIRYAEHARVSGWGSATGARIVTHLTREEREFVRNRTGILLIADCPAYQGVTERRVITDGKRFFTRMPSFNPWWEV